MTAFKKISILGSTGSIGVSTADIVSQHPDRFQVVAIAAGSNLEILESQIKILSPKLVSVKSEGEAVVLKKKLGSKSPEILFGTQGACEVARYSESTLVVSAIVGAAGLLPTLAALEKGKTVGLANKESMVIAGELMRQTADKHGAVILPIDSEHSALFQCLQGNRRDDVNRLILTASGGPFLHTPISEFKNITVEQALKHPNWSMGPKITVDSATMMNKGLEVMEARWLFDMPVDRVDICVHPQSVVHSMVEYVDGSVMAQLGVPDMRVPIAYALSFPERIPTGTKSLDLFARRELTFFKPDFEKFPSLRLAYEAGSKGGTYPAVLNASNEIVVAAFLENKIPFTSIPALIEKVLASHKPHALNGLDDVLAADSWAREETQKLL